MKRIYYIPLGIIVLITVVIVLTFISNTIQEERLQELKAEQALIDLERVEYEKKLEEERLAKAESEMLLSLGGYGKLIEKSKARFLVISDSDIDENNRYIDKATWQTEFEISMKQDGNTESTFKNYPLRGGSVVWAYLLSLIAEEQAEYDFLIVNVGEEDSSQINIDVFDLYYEKLIYDARDKFGDVEIISLLNVDDFMESDYVKSIERINQHYDALSLDVSGMNSVEISNKLMELLHNNMEERKVITDTTPESILNLNVLKEFTIKETPTIIDGFIKEGDFLRNTASTSFVEYETDKEYIYLTHLMYPKGGKFEIYVNGELTHEIDCYSEVTKNNTVMISTGELGNKTIRIEAINELADEKYIVLYSLSTN